MQLPGPGQAQELRPRQSTGEAVEVPRAGEGCWYLPLQPDPSPGVCLHCHSPALQGHALFKSLFGTSKEAVLAKAYFQREGSTAVKELRQKNRCCSPAPWGPWADPSCVQQLQALNLCSEANPTMMLAALLPPAPSYIHLSHCQQQAPQSSCKDLGHPELSSDVQTPSTAFKRKRLFDGTQERYFTYLENTMLLTSTKFL